MSSGRKHSRHTASIELNSLKSKCFRKQTPVKTSVKPNSTISHLIQDLSEVNFNIIICLADKLYQGVPK